jgi:NitT/TauT family transport system ATP-binding protein
VSICTHEEKTVLETAPAAIRCRGVTVRFGDDSEVLRGIDCRFPPGEIVSLIGASGCGKTTLLRVIAGLLPATAGEIDISPAARPNRGELAFVFQQPTLLPWRTAIDNVALSIRLTDSGASVAEVRARAERELALMELPRDAFGRFPRELSGGMKMRVSLARAMVTRPTVLLLDEPFAALDEMSRGALGDLLLRRWDARPFTAVLVTHNIAEALLLSHQIFVMAGGRIGIGITDDLPRPRDESVRGLNEFGRMYVRVSTELRRLAGEASGRGLSDTSEADGKADGRAADGKAADGKAAVTGSRIAPMGMRGTVGSARGDGSNGG